LVGDSRQTPMIRRTVLFTGHVQGVGFRYTTCRIAARHPVCGTVKNLPDGRVEAVIEGRQSDIEEFVREVAEELASNIRKTDWRDSPATGQFSGFRVEF
jgi:acylphosphatase